MPTDTGILDEAFERFHATGPEFNGALSNHGPMVVEAMVRHGHTAEVHPWIDWYQDRLEDLPRGLVPVTREDWREALGDASRLGDWTTFMLRESQDKPWRDLLVEWWPRLLPGIIAGSTHGVIRVGHAVRALLDEEAALAASGADTALTAGPRIAEFAHALGYWAARWKPLPADPSSRTGSSAARHALAAVPSVAEQGISISHRLGQLAGTPGWADALAALRAPQSPRETAALLAEVADSAALDYLTYGHAGPVMLVHASTAPTAVLRTLPALPEPLWAPSLDAAWLATAAITAAYRNTEAPASEVAALLAEAGDPRESFERAVRHGDEHAVKFADSALDVFERTGDAHALAAALRATRMIEGRG